MPWRQDLYCQQLTGAILLLLPLLAFFTARCMYALMQTAALCVVTAIWVLSTHCKVVLSDTVMFRGVLSCHADGCWSSFLDAGAVGCT
jgi:hypothetical protein